MNLLFISLAPGCSSASPKALRFVFLLSALPMLATNPLLVLPGLLLAPIQIQAETTRRRPNWCLFWEMPDVRS
jgi:hypothetical protein